MRVGFIGLGHIGEQMALRILSGGHQLVGHVRRDSGRQALKAAGALLTGSLAEAAQAGEVVCACLFDDNQLRDVFCTQGALAALRPGTVLAVHSTGSPDAVVTLADRAPEGVQVLDATFSGTAEAAARGQLTLMMGGAPAAVEAARPVLRTYAHEMVLAGGIGAGRRMKLLNNLLFAANLSLAVEAIAAAEALGLDRRLFARTVGLSSGGSYALAKFDVAPSVQEVLAIVKPYLDKDVDAAREAARHEGVDLPLMSAAARWGKGP